MVAVQRSGVEFIAVATGVVVIHNLAQDGVGWEDRIGLWIFKAALLGCVLTWAFRREHLTWVDFGLRREGLGSSLRWGLIAGLTLGIPPMVFFAFPFITADPVRYQGYVALDGVGLVATIFIHQLVATAFGEELLFRGWMQARAVTELGVTRGIAFTTVLFVLWHVVVTWQSMGRTSLVDSIIPLPLLYVATAIPLTIGGVFFSLIRLRSGNLAGSVLAHWTTNCCMLVSLAVQARGA